MLAGCIPLILSDDFELPFPDLPWESFSIKWPMHEVTTVFNGNLTMARYINGLCGSMNTETGLLFQMKKAVYEHACWFDFHSVSTDCSPLVGITRELAPFRRGGSRPPAGSLRKRSKYWSAGGEQLSWWSSDDLELHLGKTFEVFGSSEV